jgi:hypothetical protein
MANEKEMEMLNLADSKLDQLAVFMGDLAMAQQKLFDAQRVNRAELAEIRTEERQRHQETMAELNRIARTTEQQTENITRLVSAIEMLIRHQTSN